MTFNFQLLCRSAKQSAVNLFPSLLRLNNTAVPKSEIGNLFPLRQLYILPLPNRCLECRPMIKTVQPPVRFFLYLHASQIMILRQHLHNGKQGIVFDIDFHLL